MPEITSYPTQSSPTTDDVLLGVDIHDHTQSPSGTAKQFPVGDLPFDASGAAGTAQANAESYADANKLAKTANLSDLGNPAAALANLGLAAYMRMSYV